jgi:hypothetical protein
MNQLNALSNRVEYYALGHQGFAPLSNFFENVRCDGRMRAAGCSPQDIRTMIPDEPVRHAPRGKIMPLNHVFERTATHIGRCLAFLAIDPGHALIFAFALSEQLGFLIFQAQQIARLCIGGDPYVDQNRPLTGGLLPGPPRKKA